jgi:hypothetical protein
VEITKLLKTPKRMRDAQFEQKGALEMAAALP